MLRDLALKEAEGSIEVNGLSELGQIANEVASQAAFETYRIGKAQNTLRRQDADLRLFAEFLQSKGVQVGDLTNDPKAWQGVSWGLVAAFQRWMLVKEGYAIGTINVKISTVKTYARLALKAGALSAEDYALIRAVEGYSQKEKRNIDQKREDAGLDTRRSNRRGTYTKNGKPWRATKKAGAVKLNSGQVRNLKDQPDTPQGRRDRLLMCLLLDHGLRLSEVAILEVSDFDLDVGLISFYRPKVDRVTTQKLTGDTLRAALDYIRQDADPSGSLLKGSVKNPGMSEAKLSRAMSERAISKRVEKLGKLAGIDGLSPHDCRHYAATKYARTKNLRELMDIFGWASPAMAARYIQSESIVNPE